MTTTAFPIKQPAGLVTHDLEGHDNIYAKELQMKMAAADAVWGFHVRAGKCNGRLPMLFSRYGGFLGSYDILEDIEKCLRLWNIRRDELNQLCRKIWSSGWKPGMTTSDNIRSGADNTDREEIRNQRISAFMSSHCVSSVDKESYQ